MAWLDVLPELYGRHVWGGTAIVGLKGRLREEVLLAEPVIYTLDEGVMSRYQRRVLVR